MGFVERHSLRRYAVAASIAITLIFRAHPQVNTTKRLHTDAFEVEFRANGKLVVFANGKSCSVDTSDVPIPDRDCDVKCEAAEGSLQGQCHGKCSWFDPEPIAINPANESFFPGVFTGFSQNKTEIVVVDGRYHQRGLVPFGALPGFCQMVA
jgi:hypothetical protein